MHNRHAQSFQRYLEYGIIISRSSDRGLPPGEHVPIPLTIRHAHPDFDVHLPDAILESQHAGALALELLENGGWRGEHWLPQRIVRQVHAERAARIAQADLAAPLHHLNSQLVDLPAVRGGAKGRRGGIGYRDVEQQMQRPDRPLACILHAILVVVVPHMETQYGMARLRFIRSEANFDFVPRIRAEGR